MNYVHKPFIKRRCYVIYIYHSPASIRMSCLCLSVAFSHAHMHAHAHTIGQTVMKLVKMTHYRKKNNHSIQAQKQIFCSLHTLKLLDVHLPNLTR